MQGRKLNKLICGNNKRVSSDVPKQSMKVRCHVTSAKHTASDQSEFRPWSFTKEKPCFIYLFPWSWKTSLAEPAELPSSLMRSQVQKVVKIPILMPRLSCRRLVHFCSHTALGTILKHTLTESRIDFPFRGFVWPLPVYRPLNTAGLGVGKGRSKPSCLLK